MGKICYNKKLFLEFRDVYNVGHLLWKMSPLVRLVHSVYTVVHIVVFRKMRYLHTHKIDHSFHISILKPSGVRTGLPTKQVTLFISPSLPKKKEGNKGKRDL